MTSRSGGKVSSGGASFLWPKLPEPAGPKLPRNTENAYVCGSAAHTTVCTYRTQFGATESRQPGAPGKGETGLNREHWTTAAENAVRLLLPWSQDFGQEASLV